MQRLNPIEFGAIGYLTAPLFVFCASFLDWPFVLLCVPAVTFAMYRAARAIDFSQKHVQPAVVLLIAASAWTFAGGATALLGQAGDWVKHYAVFNTLAENAWPPSTSFGYLRYGLGYYLVPSLAAPLIGLSAAVALWTGLGLWLALLLLLGDRTRPLDAAVLALVVVFFSGLDYVGSLALQTQPMIMAPWHWEWWARFGQISSISTSVAWAPQHAIPVLIATGLFLRRAPVEFLALPAVAVVFWSPLTAVGLLPFWLWQIRSPSEVVSLSNLVMAPVMLVLVAYLTSGAAGLPFGWVWDIRPVSGVSLALSYILEWGLIALALAYAGVQRTPEFFIACATLLVAPLVAIGGANDFMMRATAPAIVVLAVCCFETLRSAPTERTAALIVLYTLGAVTSISELSRPFVVEPIPDVSNLSFTKASGDLAPFMPQYFSPKPFVLR